MRTARDLTLSAPIVDAVDELAKRSGLTPAETLAIKFAVVGLSNKEIANRLHITTSTVRCQLLSSYRKLGVNSRGEVSHLALQGVAELTAPSRSSDLKSLEERLIAARASSERLRAEALAMRRDAELLRAESASLREGLRNSVRASTSVAAALTTALEPESLRAR